MAKEKDKQRLLPKVCFRCKQVNNRLSQHLKYCKASDKSKDSCLRKAKECMDKLLSNAVVKKADLKRLSKMDDKKDLYCALKLHHVSLGHVFDDSGSELSSSDQEEEQEIVRKKRKSSGTLNLPQAKRRRTTSEQSSGSNSNPSDERRSVQQSSQTRSRAQQETGDSSSSSSSSSSHVSSDEEADPDLKKALRQAENPEIFDPHENTAFSRDAVKRKIRDAGLYRRFRNVRFLIKFYAHKRGKLLQAESIVKQDTEMIARLLAYLFEHADGELPLNRVNDPETLAFLLTHNKIEMFKGDLKRAGVKGETRRSFERAILSLIMYLKVFCKLSDKACAHIEKTELALKQYAAGTRRIIREERREKAVENYQKPREEQDTLEDLREFFRREDVQKQLQEIVQRSEQSDYEVSQKDFAFISQYCMGVIGLFYAQRTSIAKWMSVKEWITRHLDDKFPGKKVIGVVKHKTRAHRSLHQFAISAEHEELFEVYFENFRQVIAPIPIEALRESDEPFFITFTHKEKISNVSDALSDFQKQFKGAVVRTSRGARHIVETASRELLANNPAAQTSLSDMLGHTREMALKHYTDPRPGQVLIGAVALDALETSKIREQASRTQLEETTAALDEEKKQMLLEKYMLEEEKSEAPVESLLANDLDLCPADMTPSVRTKTAKMAYDYLRNQLKRFRIDYLARKIYKNVKAIPQKQYRSHTKEEKEKLRTDWELKVGEIIEKKGWKGLTDFNARIFPAIVSRLQLLQVQRSINEEAAQKQTQEQAQTDEQQEEQAIQAEPQEQEDAPHGQDEAETRRKVTKISKVYTDEELLDLSKSQQWPGLQIKENLGARGRGLFTADNTRFAVGQTICDYRGKTMLEQTHAARLCAVLNEEEAERIKMYRYQFDFKGETFVIEAHKEGKSVGRLMNHSKAHPNVKDKLKVLKLADGTEKHMIIFYALRKIGPNEELLWDYGPLWNDQPWYNQCPCSKCSNE